MSTALFTLCLAATAGVVVIAIADRLRWPSVALLLIAGVLLGPEAAGVIDPANLGSGLRLVVGMAVAVVLFDGGLSLDLAAARRSPVVISRLLTIGVLITWLGATASIWFFFDVPLPVALLCGSLVIVTGPTVIQPLLRRMNIRERIKDVLYWEAVLIDAVGVFVAVLCFEWLIPDPTNSAWSPLYRFGVRIAIGAGFGLAAGIAIVFVLRKHLIPEEQHNMFAIVAALLTYAGAEVVLHESGVLAVIVAGFAVRLAEPAGLESLRKFGFELTELGIGTLFILLAATLRLEPFAELGWRLAAVVAIVMFLLRACGIFAATLGQGFSMRERLFLSWLAPRGIVAAFMASLFALQLAATPGLESAAMLLHTFTFGVIGATVLLQGLSAPTVARLLGLEETKRAAWLVIGDDTVALETARAMRQANIKAIALLPPHSEDELTDPPFVVRGDPLDRDLLDNPRLSAVAHIIAITPNLYLSGLICERWAEIVDRKNLYRWCDGAARSTASIVGTPVFDHAAEPSDARVAIEKGELTVALQPASEREPSPGDVPLFTVSGDVATPSNGAQPPPQADSVLWLRHRVPGLESLVEGAIVVDSANPSLDSVVDALLDEVKRELPDVDVDATRQAIVEREQSMPTAMGKGVSIPHAYIPGLSRPRCYVASVPSGVDADTPDDRPIKLVFLVLSPPGDAPAHLTSLAAIARLCSDAEYVELLTAEASADAIRARLSDRF